MNMKWNPITEPTSPVPSFIPWQEPFHVSLNAEELTVSLFRPVFFERKKVVVINCLQGNINRDVALIIYYLKIFYPETGVRKQYLESITA